MARDREPRPPADDIADLRGPDHPANVEAETADLVRRRAGEAEGDEAEGWDWRISPFSFRYRTRLDREQGFR